MSKNLQTNQRMHTELHYNLSNDFKFVQIDQPSVLK